MEYFVMPNCSLFRPRLAAVCASALLLGACAGDGASPAVGVGPAPEAPHQVLRHTAPPAAGVMNLPGLEAVIGENGAGLIRLFGQPRLDVIEGDARKLQFTGTPCILDVYLYPASSGAEPRATYVDARRSDGRDVDRAACVAALRRR